MHINFWDAFFSLMIVAVIYKIVADNWLNKKQQKIAFIIMTTFNLTIIGCWLGNINPWNNGKPFDNTQNAKVEQVKHNKKLSNKKVINKQKKTSTANKDKIDKNKIDNKLSLKTISNNEMALAIIYYVENDNSNTNNYWQELAQNIEQNNNLYIILQSINDKNTKGVSYNLTFNDKVESMCQYTLTKNDNVNIYTNHHFVKTVSKQQIIDTVNKDKTNLDLIHKLTNSVTYYDLRNS